MRTLLVDNYDSFTYNLFHYLAQVTGDEPVVIRNDEPGWRAEHLRGFDNVVVSPGPGTPRRAADLGLCGELIRDARLPVLGVCLGHQAIAHQHGATVDRAPEPRHGRVSEIHHDGRGVFAGLPATFSVVRYHSLAVTDLPAEFEANAWTADGVLMGLRYRQRPMWGVQFHPESICTEYGHRLLANFVELSRQWHRANPGFRSSTVFSELSRSIVDFATVGQAGTAVAGPPTVATDEVGPARRRMRVLTRKLPTRWVDEVVFDHLFRANRHAFWLDSSRTDDTTGRFSIMGDASGPLARVATADVWEQAVTVESAAGTVRLPGSFFDWLDRDLHSRQVRVPDLPFDFALGWVGYLGYELKAECGGDRAHRSAEPDAVLVFADRAVVFDHSSSSTYLLALADEHDQRPALDWLAETTDRLRRLDGVRPDYTPPSAVLPVSLRHDRDRYLDLIAACRREIQAGETYEVNLTNMLRAPRLPDWWSGYQFLRRTSPAPFGALLHLDGIAVLSTSPERFLRVTSGGMVQSKPIKGTRPRGGSPYEDELLRKELTASEKDRSENLMIVDLVRNDLGRTARVGSVRVDKIFDVESYATVHQLVSTVTADLRADRSTVECVRAAFPGGSMTGAPKVRTMRIIDELEAGPRGVYSGAIGYFSLSGAADLSIVIRTAVVTPTATSYGVGGAIVALSDPDEEFEETAVKATALLRLLRAEFPGRVDEQPDADCRPAC